MAKIRFLWDNLVDLAVLSASSEASEFPVEHLAHELFLKAWRATGIDESVALDLTAITTKAVRAWAIKYHNLELASGDEYKIQGSDTDLTGAGVPGLGDTDEAFVPTDDIIIGFFAAARSFNYWRFILDSSGSKGSGDYQRVGRIFVGDYFEPTYNVSIAPQVVMMDDSSILATRQGQDYSNIVTPYEVVTYTWDMLPAADVEVMKAIYQEVGRHKPFFICEDPGAAAGAYTKTRYVKATEPWEFRPVIHGWYSVTIKVKTER